MTVEELLRNGNVRAGMFRRPENLFGGFLPGAIIIPCASFFDADWQPNAQIIEALEWDNEGPAQTATLHFNSMPLMGEHQSIALAIKLNKGMGRCNIKSEYGELWLVLSGEMILEIGSERKKYGPGSLIVIAPNQHFAVSTENQAVAIIANPEFVGREMPDWRNKAGDVHYGEIILPRWVALKPRMEPPIALKSGEMPEGTPDAPGAAMSVTQRVLPDADRRSTFPAQAVTFAQNCAFALCRPEGRRYSTTIAVFVAEGALGFENEVIEAGTLLLLPPDYYAYDMLAKAQTTAFIVGACPTACAQGAGITPRALE